MDYSRIGTRRQWVHSTGHSVCWLKSNAGCLVNTLHVCGGHYPLSCGSCAAPAAADTLSLGSAGRKAKPHLLPGIPSTCSASEWSPFQGTEWPFLSCCYQQARSMTHSTSGGSCGQNHAWRRAWSRVPPGCLLAARGSS